MRSRSLLLIAPVLLLAPTTWAAPASPPPSTLLAVHADDATSESSLGAVRLVRSRSNDAGPGAPGTRYEVFARIEPSDAGAIREIAQALGATSAPSDAVSPAAAHDPGWEWVGSVTVYENLDDGASSASRSQPATAERSLVPGEPAPAPPELALAGVRPNPTSSRALVVEFTLASDGPATLDLLDVMGRVAARRDVGALGPGRHTLSLSEGRRLAPGVYVLRLVQGNDVRVRRAAILE